MKGGTCQHAGRSSELRYTNLTSGRPFSVELLAFYHRGSDVGPCWDGAHWLHRHLRKLVDEHLSRPPQSTVVMMLSSSVMHTSNLAIVALLVLSELMFHC